MAFAEVMNKRGTKEIVCSRQHEGMQSRAGAENQRKRSRSEQRYNSDME